MDIELFERVVTQCQVFTDRQRKAAKFLELLGLRFCCEFGVNNCEALASGRGWDGEG